MELTQKESLARGRLCLPLDNIHFLRESEGEKSAESIVKTLSPYVGLFKVGNESYTRFGHDIIIMVNDHGSNIFYDQKFHDIPKTVERASYAAANIAEKGVYMFNVHTSGGIDMMAAAAKGAKEGSKKYGKKTPKVIGVTTLTSFNAAKFLETFGKLNPELNHMDFTEDFRKYANLKGEDEELKKEFQDFLEEYKLSNVISDFVLHQARLAEKAGLDGVVSSPREVKGMRNVLREGFMYVTPGVRQPGDPIAGQERVMTAGQAIEGGSTILVCGGPILDAEDRPEAAFRILQDMARYL